MTEYNITPELQATWGHPGGFVTPIGAETFHTLAERGFEVWQSRYPSMNLRVIDPSQGVWLYSPSGDLIGRSGMRASEVRSTLTRYQIFPPDYTLPVGI